jgi:translation initiation factor 1
MSNKNKNKNGIVYSTDPDFKSSFEESIEPATPEPASQNLRLWLERGKGGKMTTVIRGYSGNTKTAGDLLKELKQLCGAGGALKEGEILVQGDAREKVLAYLIKKGYNAKKAGG